VDPNPQGTKRIYVSNDAHLFRANYIIQSYGLRRFLADVDSSREYWRDPAGSSVIATSLKWMLDEGWERYFSQFDNWNWNSAHVYRQRTLIELIRVTSKVRDNPWG
jgi:hypothetical protein